MFKDGEEFYLTTHPATGSIGDDAEFCRLAQAWDMQEDVDDPEPWQELIAYIDARTPAGNTSQGVVVPDGYALVPTSLTEDMHGAMVRAMTRSNGNSDFPPNTWAAAIAAAPPPPAAALTDADINDITMAKLGKWPSFEAQSWACKVVHAVSPPAAVAPEQADLTSPKLKPGEFVYHNDGTISVGVGTGGGGGGGGSFGMSGGNDGVWPIPGKPSK